MDLVKREFMDKTGVDSRSCMHAAATHAYCYSHGYMPLLPRMHAAARARITNDDGFMHM